MLNSKPKLNTKIVYAVKNINTLDWNSISSNNIFLDLKYLESIEQTVSDVHQFIYVIYYDELNMPIGKSIFQLLQYDTSTFNFDSIPCSFTNRVLRFFLNKKITILIAGNIFATGENVFSFNKEISNRQIFNIINSTIDNLFKVNKEINYTVFKEFLPNNEDISTLVKKHQYVKFNIDANMVLKINNGWQNFEDISKDFKTKYRSRSKKVIDKSKNLIVKEFSFEDIRDNAERIENLYQQVLKNSNFNIGIFTIKTFISLKENLNEKYKVFGYFIEDKLIGFRTSFMANSILETSFIGIDYKVNLKYDLYQRMLIDYIDYGLQNSTKVIGFGRTAETIKSCVGAEPITMNLFARPKRRIGRFFMKMIVNNINPTAFSLRKPFKKQFYSEVDKLNTNAIETEVFFEKQLG